MIQIKQARNKQDVSMSLEAKHLRLTSTSDTPTTERSQEQFNNFDNSIQRDTKMKQLLKKYMILPQENKN